MKGGENAAGHEQLHGILAPGRQGWWLCPDTSRVGREALSMFWGRRATPSQELPQTCLETSLTEALCSLFQQGNYGPVLQLPKKS